MRELSSRRAIPAAMAAEAASSRLRSSRDAMMGEWKGGPPEGADEQQPFRFEARRARLDWRLLHSVDVDRMMRETDLDTLESTLVRRRAPLRTRTDMTRRMFSRHDVDGVARD